MNRMTDLLNKIERRLGTRPLNLQEPMRKEDWVEVIKSDTIPTFSRFFPHQIQIMVDGSRIKNGFYYIDESVTENYDIIGVKDLDFKLFARDSLRIQQGVGYGVYDFLSNNYGLDDIMLLQLRADATSLFNNGIYIVFEPPNLIKLESVNGGNFTRGLEGWPLIIFVNHPANLMTISPMKMETFEQLATADVATYLFNILKHYRNLETVFANVDINIETIEEKANSRNDIVEKLENSYVSAANKNQPLIYCV